MHHRQDGPRSARKLARSFAFAASLALGLASSLARSAEVILADGFEASAPASLIVHYPAGSSFITARGNGGGLSPTQGVAFARNGNTFTLDLQLTAPVQWKPLLDDTTYSLGPDYTVAAGQTVEVWPRFTTTQGQVITLVAAFQSTLLGNTRPIYAYLPPTYVENSEATFPVVYMHDGQNLYAAHPEWALGGITWQVDSAFDNGAANGSIREAIVIGIASSANRIGELTPTEDPNVPGSGGAGTYLQMIEQELKPVVDAMLRTRPDVGSTLMAGSSLGGLVTAYAGRTRPTVFGRIAALSPSSGWDNAVILDLVQSTPAAPARPLRVYLDSGDSGTGSDSVTTTTMLAATYISVGYVQGVNFQHIVQPGGMHNEAFWAQRFPGAMQFVLGPRD